MGEEGNTHQFLALERAGMGITFRDKSEDCHPTMRFYNTANKGYDLR